MAKGSKNDSEPFVMLPYLLLNSAAWTALPDKAIWTYIELKKQFNFTQGGNQHLILPYSSVSWRMSRGRFFEAIGLLVRYGFITCRERGGLYRNPNVYALSDHWKNISREIVNKEGKEAIRLGLVKKPSHRDNSKNLHQSRNTRPKSSSNG